ncbi:MAG: tetratricopeptide repeat protein [Akkermansiaceae bacterium]|nr:tetratricopeptide repeat protein [Akkermansiaceae bacterium]
MIAKDSEVSIGNWDFSATGIFGQNATLLMKKPILLAAACVLSSQAFAQSPTQQAESLYKQGQAAEKAGNTTNAKDFYTKALKADPRHANATYSLGQLKLKGPAIEAKAREAKFGAVMIPTFQLQDATLQESLMILGKIIEKESKETVIPNFIVQDSANKLTDKKLTLNLKNISSQAAMKYILDTTGAKARYDEYAVVVYSH